MRDNEAIDLAEATILGCIFDDPTRAATAFSICPTTDFDHRYQIIAHSMNRLRVSGTRISPLAVIDDLTRAGQINDAGGSSEVLRVAAFGFGDFDYALSVVAHRARLRQLWMVTARVKDQIENHAEVDALTAADTLIDAATSVKARLDGEKDVAVEDVTEFLSGEDDPADWVIPGLLERTDRLVLTGLEGLGKSSLLRQIAVCAAAGIHPFNGGRVPQQRVLIFDCENSRTQLRRALRPLVIAARQQTGLHTLPLFVESRPSGLDLTVAEDEADLIRTVAAVQPALLITGPSYRLHAKNPNDEEVARAVTVVLDRARATARCAMVLEAHSGHGTGEGSRPVRPVGSSLWLRWPEFGYGLRPSEGEEPSSRVVDLVPWRGPRDERDWPVNLRPGGVFPWRVQTPALSVVGETMDVPDNRYGRQD